MRGLDSVQVVYFWFSGIGGVCTGIRARRRRCARAVPLPWSRSPRCGGWRRSCSERAARNCSVPGPAVAKRPAAPPGLRWEPARGRRARGGCGMRSLAPFLSRTGGAVCREGARRLRRGVERRATWSPDWPRFYDGYAGGPRPGSQASSRGTLGIALGGIRRPRQGLLKRASAASAASGAGRFAGANGVTGLRTGRRAVCLASGCRRRVTGLRTGRGAPARVRPGRWPVRRRRVLMSPDGPRRSGPWWGFLGGVLLRACRPPGARGAG